MTTIPTRLARRIALSLICAVLIAASSLASAADAEPIEVSHSISIRNGNWIPLPVEDMRRAAGDAALSRLTDAGRLRLTEGTSSAAGHTDIGSLDLEIALIGPAETAKLTMRLDVEGSPTLVSTASISVRALDHAGIYDAFEHVGHQAADRLVAKLDLLQSRSIGPNGRLAAKLPSGDPARRKIYDEAQAAKRAARYAEARVAFESVVASTDDPDDVLRQLAEDELRYGLPLFEAQQSLNQLGRLVLPGQQDNRTKAISRAENLFRQIQAENPSDVARVTQAQQALDNLIVTRSALANAMRANLMSQLSGVRVAMMEFTMMEGVCPDEAGVAQLLEWSRARVTLEAIESEASGAQLYHFKGADGPGQVALRCHDYEIEIVDSDSRRRRSPAAPR